MKPYFCAETVTLYLGDCIEVMRALPEASVDAVVCDPPYGIGFMGREWDNFNPDRVGGTKRFAGVDHKRTRERSSSMVAGEYDLSPTANRKFQQWCEAWAREAYRVLKPGGHLAAFGGTRTHHRLVSGIEDAGFEIRDELDWMFGSGFPKSLDVSKAIDRMAGAEREVIAERDPHTASAAWRVAEGRMDRLTPPPITAREWQGWGTALKPAHEPICLARKPLAGTVAANVLTHGTGALNIDGCRIDGQGAEDGRSRPGGGLMQGASYQLPDSRSSMPAGRWPANVILDEEAAALLDATVGELHARGNSTPTKRRQSDGVWAANGASIGVGPDGPIDPGDRGGPSRFFYTAKASRSERDAGLDELPPALRTDGRPGDADNPRLRISERRNDHPTVKPISLMRWLCRLVTSPGGIVLDPFLGSGTTALAALDERFRIIGIDMDEHYLEVARYRVKHRHVLETVTREASESIPQGKLF